MTPEERVARIRQKLEEFGVRFDRFSTWSASELVRNEDRIKRYEEMIVEHENRLHRDEQQWRKMLEMQSVLMETRNLVFQKLDGLHDDIDRFIRGQGPNGQPG